MSTDSNNRLLPYIVDGHEQCPNSALFSWLECRCCLSEPAQKRASRADTAVNRAAKHRAELSGVEPPIYEN